MISQAYPTNLSLYDFSLKVVPPSGSGSSKIMIVGEAPGEQEDRTGIPFNPQAPAGSMLERLLKRAGFSRDQFRVTNVVWQRPPRNWLEGAPHENVAIETWRPYLEREIEQMKPRVIIALGNVALKTLTTFGGQGASITNVAQYVVPSNYDAWCIPTYHPSFLVQGQQRLSGAFIFALHRAMEVARDGFAPPSPILITEPSLEDMLAFEASYDPEHHILDYDIETPRSSKLDEEDIESQDDSFTIIRASLCYDGERAISFPWVPPYVEVAKRMLQSSGRKRGHNVNGFDNPRLAANDCKVSGRIYDTMDGWSFLQRSLPRGLAFVTPFYSSIAPWKHLSDSQPSLYSALDAYATHCIGEGIERDLKAQGKWERYESHCVDVYEVLTQMSRNGLPYDAEEAARFQADLEEKDRVRKMELQEVIPSELKRPKQKGGYKNPPKEDDPRRAECVERTFKVLGKDLTDHERAQHEGVTDHDIVEVRRLCLLTPFNPGSPGEDGQVADLIRHFGAKIGTNRKTKKGTVDDDTLKKLQTKAKASKKPRDLEFSRILQIVRECRQLAKVLGTYVKGWRPGRDGRIHATPGFWGQMYRISWRNPNISATIADKEEEAITKGFRKCVAAPSGKLLAECDWKAMESVLVGYFANDPDYIRLARLGVHDYLCSHVLVMRGKMNASSLPDLKWPDHELKRYFKDIKKRFPEDRDDAKHVCHGKAYGLTYRSASDMYELPLAAAKKLFDLYESLFPKVMKWQDSTIRRAHEEAKLTNPFGYTIWFWDALHWNSRYQRLELGTDAKPALSFLPRDTGAAMLKEVLLRLERQYQFASRGIMLASTHDSILIEDDTSRVEDSIYQVKQEMEMPVPELGGLFIEAEAAIGGTWEKDAMKEWEPTRVVNAREVAKVEVVGSF